MYKSKTAIAVFVKTPGLSPLKTRLAQGIGEEHALEFYALALDCVEETLEAMNITPYWAVGETEGLTHQRWQCFERLYTGEGGLGTRQHHIYSTLHKKYERVALIGTDSPQLTPQYLGNILSTLDTHDYAIAPAHDGGYTCLAGKRDITKSTWENVEYSRHTTRNDLCAQLNGSLFTAAPYTDIDYKDDLQMLLNEMPDAPSSSQQKLIDWIKGLD